MNLATRFVKFVQELSSIRLRTTAVNRTEFDHCAAFAVSDIAPGVLDEEAAKNELIVQFSINSQVHCIGTILSTPERFLMFSTLITSPAIDDLVGAAKKHQIIIFMAFSDLKARYKRSVLGPFWMTLSTAIGSVGLGFLWSELMKLDAKTFVPTLTAGLILWQFISGVISESTTVFNRQSSLIRNLPLPLSIHPAQLMFRHVINLAHNAPVFIIIALILGVKFNSTIWLAFPCIILVTLNLFWLALLVGLLGARFRDLEFMVNSFLPLLLFASPVFYRPNFLTFSQNIMWMNPFSHFIEIVRYPLLGMAPPWFVVMTNIALLIGGWLFTLWLFNRKHHRVAFWV